MVAVICEGLQRKDSDLPVFCFADGSLWLEDISEDDDLFSRFFALSSRKVKDDAMQAHTLTKAQPECHAIDPVDGPEAKQRLNEEGLFIPIYIKHMH